MKNIVLRWYHSTVYVHLFYDNNFYIEIMNKKCIHKPDNIDV